jgi:PAS domain S-box-containing protein
MHKGKRNSDSQCEPASEIVSDTLEGILLSHIRESNEGFALLDSSGNILFINTALEALLGLTGKKVLGTSIMGYISTEKSSDPGEFLSTVLETGKTDEVIWFISSDESVIPVISHGEKVTDGTSGAMLIALSVRNLDTVLRCIRGMEQVSGLMETILDAIPDTIGIQDMEHTVLRYNQAGYDMLGLTPEQVKGRKCFELIGLESPCGECATTEVYRTGKPAMIEKYVPDMEMWLDVRSYPILSGASGELTGVIEHMRDITEQKRIQQALVDSERKHRSLVETMSEGIAERTGNTLTFVNRSFYEMTGYTADELIGEDVRILFDESSWRSFSKQLSLRKTGIADPYEIMVTRKDGSRFPVLVSPHPEFRDGKLVKSTGVFTDISKLKEAEKEKLRLTAQVQYAQKLESLGVLAGGIAHDFNNLLMSMLGNADLALQDVPPASDAADYIREIENAARQAADLASQMLAYAGRRAFSMESLDLNDVVRGMVRILKASIASRGEIEFSLETDLQRIMADPTQIRQIVMNLVLNASEALPDGNGSIAVSTYVQEFSTPELSGSLPDGKFHGGKYVCLEVMDAGCGMDEKMLSKLFDPFFTTKQTGRGLGLASLLGIVTSHKGCFLVDSTPGVGSTFRVLFPIRIGQAETGTGTDMEPVTALCANGRILLIDDEDNVLSVGSGLLEALGFAVVTASDLTSAASLLAELENDIVMIVIDHSMPHYKGYELLRRLGHLLEGIPVVVSSGFSRDEVLSSYEGFNVRAYLAKPYGIDELRRVVHKVFNG